MNTIENLIQIVETKKSEYAELELKLDSLGILDGVIKRELTNAMNLLEWVLRVAQSEEKPQSNIKEVRNCYNCNMKRCEKCYRLSLWEPKEESKGGTPL